MHRTYLASHVKEALAADPRVASLDLKVDVRSAGYSRHFCEDCRHRAGATHTLRSASCCRHFCRDCRKRAVAPPAPHDNTVHVGGEVATDEVRRAVDEILRSLPEVEHFVNHTRVRQLASPGIERMIT